MAKADLKIDWATHSAARYACKKWHYSQCMPTGKLVKVGAWESGEFIGVVIFSRGATPNLGKPYGLDQVECSELTRIALREHKTPVSRIAAIAVRFLKQNSPALRLLVSFADVSQGHHGGIYQAGNWIYSGQGTAANFYRVNGKLTHPRSLGARNVVQNIAGARSIDPNAELVRVPGKHRYLMPLDRDMRAKIAPLSKTYPKRDKQAMADTSGTAAGQHRPSRSTNEAA